MHQSVDTFADVNKGPERCHLGDLAADLVAHLELADHAGPGIFRGLLQAEADPAVARIHFEDHRVDLFILGEDFGRMVDLAGPGHIGDMDHAVDTILELHEGAV